MVMTSHILLPQLDRNHPATMSRVVLHDLLRGELGFSGVVVSDALDMVGASGSLGMAGAAVAALRAGCDLLCLGTENTDTQLADIERAVSSAVADGTLPANRVREATSRVRGLATRSRSRPAVSRAATRFRAGLAQGRGRAGAHLRYPTWGSRLAGEGIGPLHRRTP